MEKAAIKRIGEEFVDLNLDLLRSWGIESVAVDPKEHLLWRCVLHGRAGTRWSDMSYDFEVHFSKRHPHKPPVCFYPNSPRNASQIPPACFGTVSPLGTGIGAGIVSLTMLDMEHWLPFYSPTQILSNILEVSFPNEEEDDKQAGIFPLTLPGPLMRHIASFLTMSDVSAALACNRATHADLNSDDVWATLYFTNISPLVQSLTGGLEVVFSEEKHCYGTSSAWLAIKDTCMRAVQLSRSLLTPLTPMLDSLEGVVQDGLSGCWTGQGFQERDVEEAFIQFSARAGLAGIPPFFLPRSPASLLEEDERRYGFMDDFFEDDEERDMLGYRDRVDILSGIRSVVAAAAALPEEFVRLRAATTLHLGAIRGGSTIAQLRAGAIGLRAQVMAAENVPPPFQSMVDNFAARWTRVPDARHRDRRFRFLHRPRRHVSIHERVEWLMGPSRGELPIDPRDPASAFIALRLRQVAVPLQQLSASFRRQVSPQSGLVGGLASDDEGFASLARLEAMALALALLICRSSFRDTPKFAAVDAFDEKSLEWRVGASKNICVRLTGFAGDGGIIRESDVAPFRSRTFPGTPSLHLRRLELIERKYVKTSRAQPSDERSMVCVRLSLPHQALVITYCTASTTPLQRILDAYMNIAAGALALPAGRFGLDVFQAREGSSTYLADVKDVAKATDAARVLHYLVAFNRTEKVSDILNRGDPCVLRNATSMHLDRLPRETYSSAVGTLAGMAGVSDAGMPLVSLIVRLNSLAR